MDIKSLQNSSFIDRKRADSLANSVSATKKNGLSNVSSEKNEDVVELSSSTSPDLNFAQSIYKKMDESSLERVRLIRSKVESGYYTTDKSINKLADLLKNDIYSLDAFNYESELSKSYPIDIDTLKKKIAENPDIYTEVADRLSKILSNL